MAEIPSPAALVRLCARRATAAPQSSESRVPLTGRTGTETQTGTQWASRGGTGGVGVAAPLSSSCPPPSFPFHSASHDGRTDGGLSRDRRLSHDLRRLSTPPALPSVRLARPRTPPIVLAVTGGSSREQPHCLSLLPRSTGVLCARRLPLPGVCWTHAPLRDESADYTGESPAAGRDAAGRSDHRQRWHPRPSPPSIVSASPSCSSPLIGPCPRFLLMSQTRHRALHYNFRVGRSSLLSSINRCIGAAPFHCLP